MNEQLLRDAAYDYCYALLAVARTFKKRADFYAHAARNYSLSRTRAALCISFAKFHTMCRDAGLPHPNFPENVAPLLSLPEKQWCDTWKIVTDCGRAKDGSLPNADGVKSVLDRFNIRPKRIPKHVLERQKIQRAAQTLAEVKDGEALADRLGAHGFGRNWDDAVRVTIDADQRRLDLVAGKNRANSSPEDPDRWERLASPENH